MIAGSTREQVIAEAEQQGTTVPGMPGHIEDNAELHNTMNRSRAYQEAIANG